jgi:coenzyme Q-binding protein COQ10
MITYQENRILPFRAKDLYHLVSDIEQYPTFLPWCIAARINSRTDTLIIAELGIRFGAFSSFYTSRVQLTPFSHIDVTLEKGPLNHLTTLWQFIPFNPTTTNIKFDLSVELQSSFLEKALKTIFTEKAQTIMTAFEKRAYHLYPATGLISHT